MRRLWRKLALALSAATRAAILFAGLVTGLSGCSGERAGKPGGGPPRVDRALMSCLGAIRAYHRQADLQLARNRPAKAIDAVSGILSLACSRRSNPEIREAVLDAYGRLARLHMERGELDEAARWLAKGMARKGPPSFFRANLHMVRGDLLDARARALDKAGKGRAADALRRKAIEAFEASARMNQRLLNEVLK